MLCECPLSIPFLLSWIKFLKIDIMTNFMNNPSKRRERKKKMEYPFTSNLSHHAPRFLGYFFSFFYISNIYDITQRFPTDSHHICQIKPSSRYSREDGLMWQIWCGCLEAIWMTRSHWIYFLIESSNSNTLGTVIQPTSRKKIKSIHHLLKPW